MWFRDVTTPLVTLGERAPPPTERHIWWVSWMSGGLDVRTPQSHLENLDNMTPPPPRHRGGSRGLRTTVALALLLVFPWKGILNPLIWQLSVISVISVISSVTAQSHFTVHS